MNGHIDDNARVKRMSAAIVSNLEELEAMLG